MRAVFTYFTQISLFLFLLVGFHAQAQNVQWLSWDEAYQLSQTDANPKKIFVDVYTDWCGWCKKMDKNTFQNPEVAEFMSKNFYMVKFNAEKSKNPIKYGGEKYKFVPHGRSGYHEFAVMLLNGRLSYPTVVFIDTEKNIIVPIPGYRKPKQFLEIAEVFTSDDYFRQLRRVTSRQ
ncbi:thioredoxin family protein [Flagellimonas pacifica]|uniref:Thioredoxin-related protein n=1 Tax=Flagellimonas pacifica TaxID=1247520 RepID=A0A285MSV6_9FLAO|nr:DUF255 domain-containing protein [Allomuricauda parva]SNZ00262.1 Thioredoxin-related protein [Allomuricauda parva]